MKSTEDDQTIETIRRIEEESRRREEEKNAQRIRDFQMQEEREQVEELSARSRWANFGLAAVVTWIIIMLTDKAIAPEIDLSRSFGKYIGGAFALQLFPVFFGWIARKIKFTSQKWQSVYWLTLMVVLTIRAIVISRMAAA